MPTASETRLAPTDLTRAVRRIVVGEEAKGREATERILARAEQFDIPVVSGLRSDHDSLNQKFRYEKRTLRLGYNRGSFIKPWTSDSHQVGRDEWCLTPVEGCPLDCSYCYLQDYLDRPLVTAFVNQEQMAEQIDCFLNDPPEPPPHYFSLGELSDGLFLEPLLGHVRAVWESFRGREEAHLEIRSKSHHIHGLSDQLDPHPRGIFSWSLSPETMARSDEMLTSPLKQRLAALRSMNEEGFRVGVRIDPILVREGWQESYRELVDQLFSVISPDDLAFVILGTFRFPRGFDETMEKRFPNRTFLRDEFVEGPDGTFRYARDRRTGVFDTFRSWLERRGINPDLCMEPHYVWEDAGLPINPGQHA